MSSLGVIYLSLEFSVAIFSFDKEYASIEMCFSFLQF